jgi:hypothetical protein
MREIDESENVANALFFELPKFQINRQHQESNQRNAYRQADLSVLVFFTRFVNQNVGALNGLFAREGHLLKRVSTERVHICSRLLQGVAELS